MYGSVEGNIIGILYFLLFQAIGLIISVRYLKKENIAYCVLMGSVLGSFMISWLPTLCAFFMGFTIKAHITAGVIAVVICVLTLLGTAQYSVEGNAGFLSGRKIKPDIRRFISENLVLILIIPLLVQMMIIIVHHTLSGNDGAMHAGQCTYGDMNMHLGFITSIKEQGTFPPEYSILPGTQLSYPFLSDSISSSVYIWGAGLRIAYIFPMFFALLQVFFGMVCVAKELLRKTKRIGAKLILAFSLFFFNGGLGIWYFIHPATADNFNRIFTEFYQTPTNLVDYNVQWHNVICDMLIPQRATLFGWAMLFPVISLVLKGWRKRNEHKNAPPAKDKKSIGLTVPGTASSYFVLAGIIAGGLPLIHTHSFLALGVLCIGFVVMGLYDRILKNKYKFSAGKKAVAVIAALFVLTCISMAQVSDEPLSDKFLLKIGYGIIAAVGCIFVILLVANHKKTKDNKWISEELKSWGLMLTITLIFALPQLINFTFKQAQGEQFIRGAFDWANNNPDVMDNYIIFYLKNIGIVFVMSIIMLIWGKKRQLRMVLPASFLWLICEFILFQPNPYDNNKLLLVAYLFFCIAVSDFTVETLPEKLSRLVKNRGLKVITAIVVGCVATLGTVSAAFTVGREYVSDYELYSADYVKLAEWVEANTDPKDTMLTASNHNNAVAALTGRSIVCGAGTFLYYHGLDYGTQENDVKTMYEDPSARDTLIEKYGVKYMILGDIERGSYAIPDFDDMLGRYPVVFQSGEVYVLKVS